jgi:Amino-transferase class IV
MSGGLKQLAVLWLCHLRASSCLGGWGVTRWKRNAPGRVRGTTSLRAATATTTSTVTFERGSNVSPSRTSLAPTDRSWSSTSAECSQDPSTPRLSVQLSNVTSPRAWLEAQPNGAYTVLRVDYVHRGLVESAGDCDVGEWKVWGLDFHMDRLCESYSLFLQLQEQRKNESISQNDVDDIVVATDVLQRARNMTLDMIRKQLSANEPTLDNVSPSDDDVESRQPLTTFMLTVLWTPRTDAAAVATGGASVAVTTHMARVTSSSSSSSSSSAPISHIAAPIRAVLALQDEMEEQSPMLYSRTMAGRRSAHGMHRDPLPNRFPFPQAKLSSWCRERRPLEETFKQSSDKKMGEVILCHADSSNNAVELLEGLTTNLFVLYKDGTLRTAPRTQSLNGYVRRTVLQLLAQESEVRIVERAPILEELHLWKEVFVTSSIRLVIPVQSVHVQRRSGDAVLVWETKGFACALHDGHEPSGAGSLSESVYKLLLQSMFE